MPKLGLSGGRPRTRYENGVLPAYAAAPAKKYYVSLLKKVMSGSQVNAQIASDDLTTQFISVIKPRYVNI